MSPLFGSFPSAFGLYWSAQRARPRGMEPHDVLTREAVSSGWTALDDAHHDALVAEADAAVSAARLKFRQGVKDNVPYCARVPFTELRTVLPASTLSARTSTYMTVMGVGKLVCRPVHLRFYFYPVTSVLRVSVCCELLFNGQPYRRVSSADSEGQRVKTAPGPQGKPRARRAEGKVVTAVPAVTKAVTERRGKTQRSVGQDDDSLEGRKRRLIWG